MMPGFRQLFLGLLPLFVLAHFAHHLLTAIPVPLLPLIRNEFALDYTQSGLVISAFSLAYGVGQLPAGWLSDRIGPGVLLTTGISGVAVAGLLVGLSKTYMMILGFLALMGLLGGGYHPAAPPIISSLVEPAKRGQALGFHIIGGSASYFISPIVATAIAVSWGWRGSFIWLAAPTIIFGIVLHLLLVRRTPTGKTEKGEATGGDDSSIRSGWNGRLILFIVLSMFTGAVFISIISFIPLYMVDHLRVSEETAGALLGLIYSVGLWVGPLAGYLSDRLGKIRIIVSVCLLGGPVIYLLNLVPYGWGFFILLVGIGVIIYVRMPVTESYIVEQTTDRYRSTVLGIYYFCAIEGGGIFTPILGVLIDHLGFTLSFTIAGISLLIVTLACSVGLWGSREK